jgi:hypothetical protein
MTQPATLGKFVTKQRRILPECRHHQSSHMSWVSGLLPLA